jgi:hypothetical protein
VLFNINWDVSSATRAFSSLRPLLLLPILLLRVAAYGIAQEAPRVPPVPGGAQTAPDLRSGTLKIFVLQGEAAINSVPEHTAVMPVVEVRDANNRPVEGAEVVFQLPATGPGGYFTGHEYSTKVKTNLQGQAGAAFTPNDIPGRFTIRVTAAMGPRTGHVTITQTNSLHARESTQVRKKTSGRKIAAIVAVAGGAAAVAAILATRGGHSGTRTRTITVTPGSPTVGRP